jgi:two-component system, response regulator PdtaR
MICAEAHPLPVQLWLAPAPPHSGQEPHDERDRPMVQGRALRVLIVEDEIFISLDTSSLLQSLGHTVVGIAVSADDAVRRAERERPDVVLMDIRLTGPRDGIDAADEIHRRFGINSIFVTANTDPRTRARAATLAPLGFLEKPLTQQRLQAGLASLTGN